MFAIPDGEGATEEKGIITCTIENNSPILRAPFLSAGSIYYCEDEPVMTDPEENLLEALVGAGYQYYVQGTGIENSNIEHNSRIMSGQEELTGEFETQNNTSGVDSVYAPVSFSVNATAGIRPDWWRSNTNAG